MQRLVNTPCSHNSAGSIADDPKSSGHKDCSIEDKDGNFDKSDANSPKGLRSKINLTKLVKISLIMIHRPHRAHTPALV